MDAIDTLIIASAAAAIGTIVASRFSGAGAWGGRQPRQGGFVNYPQSLPQNSAPVQQTQPITEAAYNVEPTEYRPAFGPDENQNTGGMVVLSL